MDDRKRESRMAAMSLISEENWDHHHGGEESMMPSSLAGSTVVAALDDLDLILQHVDFPTLLQLVAQVKALREAASSKVTTTQNPQRPSDDVVDAVVRIQSKLLSSPVAVTVERGEYPITDAIMDDALMQLQDEIDTYNYGTAATDTNGKIDPSDRWRRGDGSTEPCRTISPRNPVPTASTTTKSHGDSKKKGDAIAIKYSKWQTDILMSWMIDNSQSPFPETADIAQLAIETGLTHSQVVNWTTNVRKRNLKATCKGHKKPHHFIDFLFLKQDRETKQQHPPSHVAVKPLPSPKSLGRRHNESTDSLVLSSPLSPQRCVSSNFTPETFTRDFFDVEHPLEERDDNSSYFENGLSDHEHRSLLTEDVLEPLDLDHSINQDIMQDFANYWKDSNDPGHHYHAPSNHHWPAPEAPPSRTPHRRYNSGSVVLLPSVTSDSHEDDYYFSAIAATSSHHGLYKRIRPTTPPLLPLEEPIYFDRDEIYQHDDIFSWSDNDDVGRKVESV